MKNRQFAKKRMMFIQNEDYNFLTYNLLILLNELDCTSEKKKFRDFRRIAYLIEFISTTAELEDYEKYELSSIYLRAQLKKKLLSHLLITLKTKGYLDITLNSTHNTLDIWIEKNKIPKEFFNKKYFSNEVLNIKKIRKYTKITKVSTLKKLIEDIFTKQGVSTWEI